MNSEQQELWSMIRSFDIDGGPSSLTFSKRLARENGWSHGYAQRVIDEYRKFVFLCMTSGHKCTPSDEVDQAWHLHMIYTESYWLRFCGEILPRPLHHGPTKGGQAEDDKFVNWYERTKESYRIFFRQAPPSDIWPSTHDRFRNATNWKRIDQSRFWMIPKLGAPKLASIASIASLLALSGIGCSYFAQSETSTIGPILIVLLVLVVIILIAVTSTTDRRKNGNESGGSGCSSAGSSPSGCSSHHDSNSDSSGCGSSGCGGGGCGGGGCGS